MKNNVYRLLLIISVIFVSGCVPNKNVAYLQYGNEYGKPETIVVDTVVRKYESGQFYYKLQPGDQLDIKIATLTPKDFNPFMNADPSLLAGQQFQQQASNTESTTGYYLDAAGNIALPLIGSVKVGGSTLVQAEDSLQRRVMKYLDQPVVKIRIQNFRFTVLGEVKSESTLLSYDNSLNLLQAIGKAGGVSEFGDLSRVKVVRRIGENSCVFYVNLLQEKFLSSPFYYVQPGDVITVAPIKQRSYLKYMSPNLSILTATTSLFISILTLFTVL